MRAAPAMATGSGEAPFEMIHRVPPGPPQVSEDMTFQRRSWRAERLAWGGMALIVAAALAGLFANGPLAWTSRLDASGLLRVDYGRIERLGARTTLALEVDPRAFRNGAIALEVDETFLKAFAIVGIRPAPAMSTITPEGHRLRFRAEGGTGGPAGAGGTGETGMRLIHIDLRPERMGPHRIALGLAGRAPLDLSVFILP